MLFWIYTISNSIGIVVMNLADAVYYRYTFKRITSEEMHFFRENDNTGSIILKSMGIAKMSDANTPWQIFPLSRAVLPWLPLTQI